MLSFNQFKLADLTGIISKASLWVLFSLILSACTFSPVYSNQEQTGTNFNLEFATANSRLEQIVYTDLAASFPSQPGPKTNLVEVIVSSSNVRPGFGSVALTGKITVTNIETSEIVFSGSRTAAATYIKSPQSLANQQAANEASERAAKNLAQTIRLTLIGILSAR